MPKVSVIIPTHNRPESLSQAIRSVLDQTFQDFEIIVVDDASKIDNRSVIQRFSDSRIRYVRHETNQKEVGSRNTGVTHATGEYVAFLDDDDEWLPEKLALQVRKLTNSPESVGLVYTGRLTIDKNSGKILNRRIPSKKGNVFRELFVRNFITVSSVMVRRVCFERIGLFNVELPNAIDHDMWIRIARDYDFDYVQEPLVKYHIHQSQLNCNLNLIIRGWEAKFKKYDRYFAENPVSYSRHYRRLGILKCLNGNTQSGREAYLEAIRLYPFDIRNYLMFGLSLLGPQAMKSLLALKERIVVSSRPHVP